MAVNQSHGSRGLSDFFSPWKAQLNHLKDILMNKFFILIIRFFLVCRVVTPIAERELEERQVGRVEVLGTFLGRLGQLPRAVGRITSATSWQLCRCRTGGRSSSGKNNSGQFQSSWVFKSSNVWFRKLSNVMRRLKTSSCRDALDTPSIAKLI